ncbi:MAG TPA: GNAT family N-acetyltransferase [Gaiellaceae bacterium]|nr:GNAT family N-acetyltransferase [Gaiellaceae bacterium]
MTDLTPLKGAWRPLAERSRNVFATWEWADTWWRHFGRGGELRVTCERASFLLPLYVRRQGPFRVLRFVGHGHADELGPIGDRGRAAEAFGDVFAEGGFHLFLGEELTPGWDTLLGAHAVERTSSPVIALDRTWDEYLAARSANFRSQVRSAERRLENPAYRLTTPETLEADLDTLFRLHRARWPGSHWFADAEAFHREFAAIALGRGWLRLWTLELGGKPAAAWLGYRFNGVESYYQAGRDPALQRERVGFVLLAHTIREAIGDGMSEYRLLRGDESFKYRFATSDPGLETLARPTGVVGRLALALRTVRRRAS